MNVSGGESSFDGLVNLASADLGARVLEANDDFFAEKENLLKPGAAVFHPDRYTERGKWMDGWETRRRRTPGHDWCIVALAAPGTIRRVVVDTTHFRGNHPEFCSIEGRTSKGWQEILAKTELAGDSVNVFHIDSDSIVEAVRLNIYPDGGVARLRVFGLPRPAWEEGPDAGSLDLASALHGAVPLACSDRFFGEPEHLLKPGESTHMGDGWETRRRRGSGHDWVVLRLACRGEIDRAIVDTSHFKGNYPASCRLECCDLSVPGAPKPVSDADWAAIEWVEILPMSELGPDRLHEFTVSAPAATHVRFAIHPDGGVARLRLLGRRRP